MIDLVVECRSYFRTIQEFAAHFEVGILCARRWLQGKSEPQKRHIEAMKKLVNGECKQI
jgi:hypothetical protein